MTNGAVRGGRRGHHLGRSVHLAAAGVLCSGWADLQCPTRSPGKKETHKVGRNPATQRVALEPDLGGGSPLLRVLGFVREGSPASVSSSVRRLPPDPDLPVVVGRLPSEVCLRLRSGGEVGTAPDHRQIRGSLSRGSKPTKGGLVVQAGHSSSGVLREMVQNMPVSSPRELARGCSWGVAGDTFRRRSQVGVAGCSG